MIRRLTVFAALIVTLPYNAMAEVRLSRSSDGSVVIFNTGASQSRRGGRGIDYAWLASQRNRETPYDAIIERYSREAGVDPVLVKAIITVESNFDPGVVSSKGARGLMQLMPATAKRFGVSSIHDPEQNIRGGIAFVAHLERLFGNDLERILAGYNAGENAVLRYGGIPPYSETRMYVAKALTVYYGRPMGGGTPVTAADFGRNRLQGGFKSAIAPVILRSSSNRSSLAAQVNRRGTVGRH